MNVSIENQVIWLAPERTGSSITKKIFENYNFFSSTKKNDYNLVDFRQGSHSHEKLGNQDFSNFKKILNTRNPYDRVFACYQNFFLEKPILKSNVNFKQKFTKWVFENFWSQGPLVFLSTRYEDNNNFFQNWTFQTEDVDFYIRMENLKDDILNLPFISKTKDEITRIENLLEENRYINERHYTFQDVYDQTSAKLIYEFFKPCFYKFNYEPFSFTKDTLSENEKISFIHGLWDQ
jgi:hypothetical protein